MIQNSIKVVLFSLFMLLCTVEKEEVSYQLCVKNSVGTTKYGIPYERFDIVELQIGEAKWHHIPAGEQSLYQPITPNTPLDIVCTYDILRYNVLDKSWDYVDTKTKYVGTEIFSQEEDYQLFVTYLDLDKIGNEDMQFATYGCAPSEQNEHNNMEIALQ